MAKRKENKVLISYKM